jgi:hypothetical protein
VRKQNTAEVLDLSPSRSVALAFACALFLALISAALVATFPSDASCASVPAVEASR